MLITVTTNYNASLGHIKSGVARYTTSNVDEFTNGNWYYAGFIKDAGVIKESIKLEYGPTLSECPSHVLKVVDVDKAYTEINTIQDTISGSIDIGGIYKGDIVGFSIIDGIVTISSEDSSRYKTLNKPIVYGPIEKAKFEVLRETKIDVTGEALRPYSILDFRLAGPSNPTNVTKFGCNYGKPVGYWVSVRFDCSTDLSAYDGKYMLMDIVNGKGMGDSYTGILTSNGSGMYTFKMDAYADTLPDVFTCADDTVITNMDRSTHFRLYDRAIEYKLPEGTDLADIDKIHILHESDYIQVDKTNFTVSGDVLKWNFPAKSVKIIKQALQFDQRFTNLGTLSTLPTIKGIDSLGNEEFIAESEIKDYILDNNLDSHVQWTQEAHQWSDSTFAFNIPSTIRDYLNENTKVYLGAKVSSTVAQPTQNIKLGLYCQKYGRDTEPVYFNEDGTVYEDEIILTDAVGPVGMYSIPLIQVNNTYTGSYVTDYFNTQKYDLELDLSNWETVPRIGITFSNRSIAYPGFNVLVQYIKFYEVALFIEDSKEIQSESIYIDFTSILGGYTKNTVPLAVKQIAIDHCGYSVSTAITGDTTPIELAGYDNKNTFELLVDVIGDGNLNWISEYSELVPKAFYSGFKGVTVAGTFTPEDIENGTISELSDVIEGVVNDPVIRWTENNKEYYCKFRNIDSSLVFPSFSADWTQWLDTNYPMENIYNDYDLYSSIVNGGMYDWLRSSYESIGQLITGDVRYYGNRTFKEVIEIGYASRFKYLSYRKRSISFQSNINTVKLGDRVRVNHPSILGNAYLYGFVNGKNMDVLDGNCGYSVLVDLIAYNSDSNTVDATIEYIGPNWNGDIINDQLGTNSFDTFMGRLGA